MTAKNIVLHKHEIEFETYTTEISAGVIFRFKDGTDTFIKTTSKQIVSLQDGGIFKDINHGGIEIVHDEFIINPSTC